MKKSITYAISLCAVLFFFYSCQQEENLSSTLGKATFSLSPQTRSNGRVSETTTPAFVLLSIKDGNGNVQDNIKLPLYALGQSYLSENLDLRTGTYQLTQFAVLDAANKVIYATPLEGSDLAKYVTHPLPMHFNITENQNTQVVPQVLAVSAEDTPERFGLASFGFEVIKVAVIKASFTGVEAITKVSYQFTNGTQTISSDIILTNSALDLNIPELMGKTWQARILAWTEVEDCFQKVYCFSGELTFDSSVLQLPSLETESWVPFFYVEENKIGIFRSDPRRSYQIEVQLAPHEIKRFYGYVDRNVFNSEGEQLCDVKYSEFETYPVDANGLIKVSIPDQYECDLAELGSVDSFLMLIERESGLLIVHYFQWEVKDDSIKPYCTSDLPNGRLSVYQR